MIVSNLTYFRTRKLIFTIPHRYYTSEIVEQVMTINQREQIASFRMENYACARSYVTLYHSTSNFGAHNVFVLKFFIELNKNVTGHNNIKNVELLNMYKKHYSYAGDCKYE